MSDDLQKQMVFEANRKSVGVAYLLWFFLGSFGAHRFYSGRTKSALAQVALLISVVGWLVLIPWLLIDLVLIPGIVREQNMQTISQLTQPAPTHPVAPPQAQPPRQVNTEAGRKREAMLEDLRATGYKKERRDSLYR